MKNIKSFDSFINEELSPETYLSAAEKLDKKGHVTRANNLKLHRREMINKDLEKEIEPITVEMYGETFFLGPKAVTIDENFDGKGGMIVEVRFDPTTPKEREDWREEGDYDAYYFNFFKEGNKYDFQYDGMVLPNRRVANQILRLAKKYVDIAGNSDLKAEMAKISPNDMFEE